MNKLISQNPIAASLLINEDIYQIKTPNLAFADIVVTPIVPALAEEITPNIPPKPILKPVAQLPTSDKPSYIYTGDNHKSILIIINEPDAETLKKEDLLALNKLLAARKLEIKDVALLNIQKNDNLNYTQLKDFFGFNKLLLFGINPKELGIIGMVANQIFIFEGIPILGTWHLKQMQLDEKKKLIFWTEFKKLL